MKERIKSLIPLLLMTAIIILCFNKILFTGKIVRAPDILNEFYWSIKDIPALKFSKLLEFNLKADWLPYENSGVTTEGGWIAQQFLVVKTLLFWLIPTPVNIAWFMVLNLAFGAIGTYAFCRLLGSGPFAAMIGGLLFAIAPENSSLINAGHVLKIATICFAPWVFYCYERAVRTRRYFWVFSTGMVLAFQFFHGHWQIAFYTCLALALYGIIQFVLAARVDSWSNNSKLIIMNLVLVLFFLSSVAISLAPLASWSRDTNRGAQSGENSGKGGLNRDEAMSWSLPPEELVSFVIPGFFGLSRQEAGENPSNIKSYYWGRMNFTQTSDYMGLLPWLLLPLPLLFRRDRYTWMALAAIGGGLLFSCGKYSLVYQLLYDHFPGINRFRVPKMMMFIPLLGLSVLAARGIDCLRDSGVRATTSFRRYMTTLWFLPIALILFYVLLHFGRSFWIDRFVDILAQPTRYEQGLGLIDQRWNNILLETLFASGVALFYVAIINLLRFERLVRAVPLMLLVFLLVDIGRINSKFLFLVDLPQKAKSKPTAAIEYLMAQPGNYRTLPLSGDPMQYSSNRVPVMFTSSPVQQKRWQDLLDNFGFASPVIDILNVRYLVMSPEQYRAEFSAAGNRFAPVFVSPDGGELVVENRHVMPKGWLVSSIVHIPDKNQLLNVILNPAFEPQRVGLVETLPPLPMEPAAASTAPAGEVTLKHYEGERIDFEAKTVKNALLITGEKFANGWKARVDGKPAEIHRVDYVLRGVYLPPGVHEVSFYFDPISFKVGKWLTLSSFGVYLVMLVWEWRRLRSNRPEATA